MTRLHPERLRTPVSRGLTAVVVLIAGLALTGCYGTGTGTAYVGVYGGPVYGPGPWGGYPGRYGPYGGGGVWVGVPVCCEEEQQEDPEPEAGAPASQIESDRPAG